MSKQRKNWNGELVFSRPMEQATKRRLRGEDMLKLVERKKFKINEKKK